MARSTKRSPLQKGRAFATSSVRLAFWRVRRTWGLLLVTGIGMIAAVMIVCMVPLYSRVTMSGGLRQVLSSPPQNGDVTVQSFGEAPNQADIENTTDSFNQAFQQKLGPYLRSSHLSIEAPPWPLLKIQPDHSLATTPDNITFITDPLDQAAQHLRLIQGRLPQLVTDQAGNDPANGLDIEVALTPQEATSLDVAVGSIITTQIPYLGAGSGPTLRLHIVGLFTPFENTTFWRGHNFQRATNGDQPGSNYAVLASTETFLSLLDTSYKPTTYGLILSKPLIYFWTYSLDPLRVNIDNLDAIVNGIHSMQVDIAENRAYTINRFEEQTVLVLSSNAISEYQNRVAVIRIPVMGLLVLVIGLVLFFVSMMADLLVDRQTESIAILRSRGTSRSQIFAAFATQSAGLGLLALFTGPFLAVILVQLIAQPLLAPDARSAVQLIEGNPLPVVLSVTWFALAAVVVVMLAMAFSILRVIRADVLTLRREMARSTHRPVWLRLNLDIFAIIVMLTGYGILSYLTNSDALDARSRLVLLSPLTLLGAVCILIAGILLFLRLFPFLLEMGTRLSSRGRGAPPVLALAQMARAPRQPVRMTLLLALASALTIFSLVFISSQAQRRQDVSALQSGADFSGQIEFPTNAPGLSDVTTLYRQLPGVTNASLGYVDTMTSRGKATAQINLLAMDTDTFAGTAIWTSQDSVQPLPTLTAMLASRRASAIARNQVPAIIDAQTVTALHIAPGGTFVLDSTASGNINVTFVVIAVVEHIPTISSSSQAGPAGDFIPTGGIFVDYRTYDSVYQKDALAQFDSNGIPVNTAWLRTSDNAASLAKLRDALKNSYLDLLNLRDRRAILDDLNQDSLSVDLIGVLGLCAVTALLLALLGNLLTSWLSARSRLTNFVVMRALGTSPRQVASVLTWEQGIIYTAAMLLGIAFGALFSILAVPALVFTGATDSGTTNGAFFISQSVPPIQVSGSFLVVLALLTIVAICIVALGLMIRVVSRPAIGQVLRLNED